MRINQHLGNLMSQKWNANAQDKQKILEQLATGKRINTAADDPAGVAIASVFDSQIRAYRSASDNLSDGMNALAISDGGASTINDMLQRQKELAVQSANGALNSDQRSSLDNEYQSLTQEIDRISKSTDFNGQQLLDGSSPLSDGTGKIQAGSGSGDTITLTASDLSAASLNLGPTSLLSPDKALQAMSAIDSAMKKVNDNRASQGALSNTFEFAQSNLQTQGVNATQGLSNIEDLNYAQALTDKVKSDILTNSSASALAQFNQLSRTHLLGLLQ